MRQAVSGRFQCVSCPNHGEAADMRNTASLLVLLSDNGFYKLRVKAQLTGDEAVKHRVDKNSHTKVVSLCNKVQEK